MSGANAFWWAAAILVAVVTLILLGVVGDGGRL